MKILLRAAAGIQLLYYGLILSYAGIRTTFAGFWLISGSVCLFLSGLKKRWLDIFKYPLGIGGAFFIIQEFRIILGGIRKPKKDADYVIILGAQVKGDRPSRSLLLRIGAATAYAKANPGCRIIATGGQGPDEAISEAACIRNTLVGMGIEPERIRLEDQSVNTRENLRNSLKFGSKQDQYVIVTNRFHLFRALAIGRDLGMTRISGLGAPSEPILLPNYYVREFFAWVFYKIMKGGGKI